MNPVTVSTLTVKPPSSSALNPTFSPLLLKTVGPSFKFEVSDEIPCGFNSEGGGVDFPPPKLNETLPVESSLYHTRSKWKSYPEIARLICLLNPNSF